MHDNNPPDPEVVEHLLNVYIPTYDGALNYTQNYLTRQYGDAALREGQINDPFTS